MNMRTFKYISLIFTVMMCSTASAEEAMCVIEIEDVNAGTKYKIEQKFTFTQDSGAQWKNFKLPGSTYNCNFAFFNLESGTMLSCEFDEAGNDFAQSDRSGNEEPALNNHLSFRREGTFYSLVASCM